MGYPGGLWLTGRVRLYTKYKVVRSRSLLRALFYSLLALSGLVFLGWVFWHASNLAEPEVLPERGQTARTNRPPLPVTRPNMPPPSGAARTNRMPPLLPAPVPGTPLMARTITPVPSTTNAPAPFALKSAGRKPQNVLEGQIALTRSGISCGSLDGVMGSQTRAALRAFQQSQGLAVTGELDAPTRDRLLLDTPPLSSYTLTSNDLARLGPVGRTWLEKSEQERMDYETALELVAEKSRSHPGLIRRLNPEVDWANVVAGTVVRVPQAAPVPPHARVSFIRIHLTEKTLDAFDASSNLLAHYPCSIARQLEKRPVGELHVAAIAANPNYTFNPELFPESAEARQLDRRLLLPAGPNNPVGTAWIGLDRPGYGIHGTPKPEDVGRTESHGCFRLANWNVEQLLQMLTLGVSVFVEP